MNNWQRKVADFHEKFGAPNNIGKPIEIQRGQLRADLIEEEAAETVAALTTGDVAGAIDGIVDTIYVCLGAALEMGVDLEPYFAEVHDSNMRKTPGHSRADGKILKGPGWVGPRIAEMVAAHSAKVAK